MAELVDIQDGDNKFPNSRIGKTPFITSIRDFAPDGVLLGIERVSRVFPVKQDPEKAQLMLELVIQGDMEKCRMYLLDDDGEYINMKDELTGKEARKLVIEPVKGEDLVTFPMFLPCGKPKEITNEAELIFYPKSSAYPLFKFALQQAGELPAKMPSKPFKTTQEELKECLEGLQFIGKCEEIKGTYNYVRLIAEPVE